MGLVRPTDTGNVVPATVAAIDQIEKIQADQGHLTSILNLLLQGGITQMNAGSATISWPGGSPFSSTLDVSHGMTGVGNPKIVLATANATGSVQLVTFIYQAGGPVGTFRIFAATTDGSSPAVSSTTGFSWLAIN